MSVSEQRCLSSESWTDSTPLPQIVSCNERPCCARAAFQMAGSRENTGISVEMPIAQACRIIFRRSETTKWVANGQTGSLRVQTDINVTGYLNNKVMSRTGINVLLWHDVNFFSVLCNYVRSNARFRSMKNIQNVGIVQWSRVWNCYRRKQQ